MHEHQFDLIAALADGSATPEEARVAEAAMVDCVECRNQHTAQVEVLTWLKTAPPVQMTDLERASLHRRIAADTKPRVGWFTRYAPRVAAVAAGFAVVGLATVSMLGRGADTADISADTVAATEEAAVEMDTSARQPSLANDSQMESAGAPAAGADVVEDEATGDMAAEAPADDGAFGLFFFDQAGLRELLEGELPSEFALSTEEVLNRFREACPDSLEDSVIVDAAIEATLEGTPAFVVIATNDPGRTVTAYSVENCEILDEVQTGN